MRHSGLKLGVFVIGLALVCGNAVAGNRRDDIRSANKAFYAALNRMFAGDNAPMAELWSHATDVTYMGPAGGIKSGWEAVWKEWEAQAALKLGGHVDGNEIRMFHDDRQAVVVTQETGENTSKNGIERVSIRATNVFRKEHGRWKMIHHHTDLLPYLAK
jgi:ketosteroid isomerase-like protein